MSEAFNIFELLDEAKQAQEQALTLPPEVRLTTSPDNLVRLKLLTIANVITLADAAAKNPKRWEALKLHFHFPEWTQKRIADFVGVHHVTVSSWLRNPLCDPEEYWNNLPPDRAKEPTTYRIWEDVPQEKERKNFFGTVASGFDTDEEDNKRNEV